MYEVIRFVKKCGCVKGVKPKCKWCISKRTHPIEFIKNCHTTNELFTYIRRRCVNVVICDHDACIVVKPFVVRAHGVKLYDSSLLYTPHINGWFEIGGVKRNYVSRVADEELERFMRKIDSSFMMKRKK